MSLDTKKKYSEIIPVLSGNGKACSLTLLGRRRDNPSTLDKILTQAWKEGEPVAIGWKDSPSVSPSRT